MTSIDLALVGAQMTPEALARQEANWTKLQAIRELEELEVVDVDVWYQMSRKFRSIGRLPEGKTAQEALLEAKMDGLRRDFRESSLSYKYWAKGSKDTCCSDGRIQRHSRVHYGLRALVWRTH